MAEADLARNDWLAVADDYNRRFAATGTRAVIETVLEKHRQHRIALVSGFGANSVVLLHLVASIDPDLPVLFVDTGKHFADTRAYRDRLAARLGLTDIRTILPEPSSLAASDPHGALWMRDREACCALRKVQPFRGAIAGFDIWISGRKRYQGEKRSAIDLFETDGARLKINPLAHWTRGDIEIWRNAFDLPQHPLVLAGYASIGCEPCTSRTLAGEDERAGRWRGAKKTECGIHVPDETGGLP